MFLAVISFRVVLHISHGVVIAVAPLDSEPEQRRLCTELIVFGLTGKWLASLFVFGVAYPVSERPTVIDGVDRAVLVAANFSKLRYRSAVAHGAFLHPKNLPC